MKLVIEFDENPLVASRYWERRRIDGRSKEAAMAATLIIIRPRARRRHV